MVLCHVLGVWVVMWGRGSVFWGLYSGVPPARPELGWGFGARFGASRIGGPGGRPEMAVFGGSSASRMSYLLRTCPGAPGRAHVCTPCAHPVLGPVLASRIGGSSASQIGVLSGASRRRVVGFCMGFGIFFLSCGIFFSFCFFFVGPRIVQEGMLGGVDDELMMF